MTNLEKIRSMNLDALAKQNVRSVWSFDALDLEDGTSKTFPVRAWVTSDGTIFSENLYEEAMTYEREWLLRDAM